MKELTRFQDSGDEWGWSFALYRRECKPAEALVSCVVGVVTETESLMLTYAMIATLPGRLWIEGGPSTADLSPIVDAALLNEPLPAVSLGIREDSRGTHVSSRRLFARDIPPFGLILTSELSDPPPGWPR